MQTEPMDPTVVLNKWQISDLFFNHENAHLAEAYAGSQEGLDDNEVREALIKDAADFAATIGDTSLTDWLVDDFMRRR